MKATFIIIPMMLTQNTAEMILCFRLTVEVPGFNTGTNSRRYIQWLSISQNYKLCLELNWCHSCQAPWFKQWPHLHYDAARDCLFCQVKLRKQRYSKRNITISCSSVLLQYCFIVMGFLRLVSVLEYYFIPTLKIILPSTL